MDLRRNEIIQAELKAKEIIEITKNRFLNDLSKVNMNREKTYFPNITKWVEISGYRAANSHNENYDLINDAVNGWISSKRSIEDEIGFAIVINGDATGLYYGSRRVCPNDVFLSTIPECKMIEKNPKPLFTQYNGIMLGSIEGDNLATLLLNSDMDHCFCSLFIVPYTINEIENRVTELENCYHELESFRTHQISYGSATRRIETITNDTICEALEILQEHIDFIKKYRNVGLVRTIVKYGANDSNTYNRLKSILHSVMRISADSYCEPIRSYRIEGNEYDWNQHLSVPYATYDGRTSGVHLLSIQSIDRISKLCMMPLQSTKAFFVKNYNVDENSMRIYGAERKIEGDIHLGLSIASNKKIGIPLNKLTYHTCVFGSTGAGKTTTVKKLLVELNKRKIPFVVVEAAKKEYVELINKIPSLSVYTPGSNGKMLILNPMEPEDGILIENQVDMLVRSIIAAHGNEHPIPESFEGLLKFTYEKNGWRYGDIAYRDERRPFPTFKDVYDNISDYINEHAMYGAEVKQNLTAALTLRSENLYSGALGKCFNCNTGLKAKDILSSSVLIELADFSEGATTLIMNVLMYKLQSYLGQCASSTELKHVIVVEEAHNVFRKTNEEGSGRDVNNQYVDKMFSEIRSSGTGIVISDQRPEILSDAVIANTAIKIIHSMEQKVDRNIVADALDLSEIQKKRIRELKPGECLLSMRGVFGQEAVKIEPVGNPLELCSACIFCNSRFNCVKKRVCQQIGEIPISSKRYYLAKLSNNPYNAIVINDIVDGMMSEFLIEGTKYKLCFLGMLLASEKTISFETSRIITNTYRKHLRGEGE